MVVACGWCGGRGDTRVIKVRGRAYTRPHAVVARAGSHIAGDGGVSRTFHVCCFFFACDCAVNAKAAALPCSLRQFGGLPRVDGGVEGGDAL